MRHQAPINQQAVVSQQVSIIFLSMALVAALSELQKSPKTVFHWLAFVYFTANNIRYFYGDMRWSELDINLRRDGLGVERALDIHLYVITRLLIVMQALQISNLQNFLWMLMAAQFVGEIYLAFSINLIYDSGKDVGPVKLIPIQWHWFSFNITEMVITGIAAFILKTQSDLQQKFPSLNEIDLYSWTLAIAFTLLFLVQIFDWIMHQEFLFGRSRR